VKHGVIAWHACVGLAVGSVGLGSPGAQPAVRTPLVGVEREGIIFRVSQIKADVEIEYNALDVEIDRRMTITAQVSNPSSRQSFRLRSGFVLTELADEGGRNMLPFQGAPQLVAEPRRRVGWPGFSHATDGYNPTTKRGESESGIVRPLSQSFQSLPSLPRRLSRMTGYVDVEIAKDIKEFDVPAGVSAQPLEVAPGFFVSVNQFQPRDNGTTVGVDIRIRNAGDAFDPEKAPVVDSIMLMEGDLIVGQVLSGSGILGSTTDNGYVGAMTQYVAHPNRKPTSIRVRYVGAVDIVRLAFEYRDIPVGDE
jgi:hypothetical protein